MPVGLILGLLTLEVARMNAVIVDRAQGEIAKLGVASMRLILSTEDSKGAYALTEFRGGEGAWTVPHVHQHMEEAFYVLEGRFTFTIGDRDVEAEEGDFLLVPRGTRHLMHAGTGGGALLVIFAPGGLERMFLELGRLPADSITNPAVRADISRRHDSVPV